MILYFIKERLHNHAKGNYELFRSTEGDRYTIRFKSIEEAFSFNKFLTQDKDNLVQKARVKIDMYHYIHSGEEPKTTVLKEGERYSEVINEIATHRTRF